MLASLRHLLFPHSSNNHRPHLLHPQGLAVLVAIFLLSHSSFRLFAQVQGNVLGYASSITPEQILAGINTRRVEFGLTPLTLNPRLTQAALSKASDMFTFDYWAHTSPQGKEPWDFIKAAGYQYRYAGENLARDFGDTASLIDAWMASPTHKDNIINPRYTETGLAVVNGTLQGIETTLVVHFFGAPATQSLVLPVQAAAASPSPLPTPLSTAVLESAPARLSPLLLEQVVATSIVALLILVLAFDALHAYRFKLVRLVGNNLAHLLFILTLLAAVWLTRQGGLL